MMSIYSELLRAALEATSPSELSDVGDEELLDRWRRRRRALDGIGLGSLQSEPVEARLGELLASDVLLTELCRRLGIEERLTDPSSGPRERERVERVVARYDVTRS